MKCNSINLTNFKPIMKRLFLLSSILVSSLASSAYAKDLETDRELDDKWAFSATIENDIFANDDSNYTNGVRFSWLSPETTTPHWIERFADASPFFNELGNKRISYSFGQNMYTPENIITPTVIFDERPYAGWLYGSAGLISDTGEELERLELTLGIVGPSSLAEQTQAVVHHAIGAKVPRGWDNQLKDEPGFILAYEKAWKNYLDFGFLGLGMDATPKAGFALGNVSTYGSTGVTFRLGRDLPSDYGPPKISPRISGSEYFVPTKTLGFYLFADFEGRAVGRDVFLDGNTFRDSHHVDKEILVGDAQVGAAMTLGNYRLAYTQVFRTKEFETQRSNGEDFGALTLSVKF